MLNDNPYYLYTMLETVNMLGVVPTRLTVDLRENACIMSLYDGENFIVSFSLPARMTEMDYAVNMIHQRWSDIKVETL